jgi:hypothetical protein
MIILCRYMKNIYGFYVAAFIMRMFFIFLSLDFSCYARLPLNSGWRINGGTRSTVL